MSVSRIVGLYPQEPCSQCHWPIYSTHLSGCSVKDAIDNANSRGRIVETLLTQYVKGEPLAIPAGCKNDPEFIGQCQSLFEKAARWFDQQNFSRIECQVLVADEDTGGVIDFRCDGKIIDLKTVYSLSETHHLQVGGYGELSPSSYMGWLLHVTSRKKNAEFVQVKYGAMEDFRALRDVYRMVKRLGGIKEREGK